MEPAIHPPQSGPDPGQITEYVGAPTYPPPHEAPGRKPSGGLNLVWIVIVVVVILGLVLLVWLASTIDLDGTDDPVVFESDVVIAVDGHFRHTLVDSWSGPVDARLNVTSIEGGRFDVYIMDREQYENAYGNETTGSFSFLFRAENVTRWEFAEELDAQDQEIYCVIDNMDNPLLQGDATPVGPITVHIRMSTEWAFQM
jgi:hypothetical protein